LQILCPVPFQDLVARHQPNAGRRRHIGAVPRAIFRMVRLQHLREGDDNKNLPLLTDDFEDVGGWVLSCPQIFECDVQDSLAGVEIGGLERRNSAPVSSTLTSSREVWLKKNSGIQVAPWARASVQPDIADQIRRPVHACLVAYRQPLTAQLNQSLAPEHLQSPINMHG
jgi:hypothetical protein